MFGPNTALQASCVYDYSHRDQTKAETFQEFSEEDGFILSEDRDLHHNSIHMDPSELKPGENVSSDTFIYLTKHTNQICTKIYNNKCLYK